MFKELESNISRIISHCLIESISNQNQAPFYISSTQITEFFPPNLNITEPDITQQFAGGWQVNNPHINCYFGLELICHDENHKHWIKMNLLNTKTNANHSLFIQPIHIQNVFISNRVQSEWQTLNDTNHKGILCRFYVMNKWYEFGVIPFVKCIELSLNPSNDEDTCPDNDRMTHLKPSDPYDDWYCQQYLEYYGFSSEDSESLDDEISKDEHDDDDEDIDLYSNVHSINRTVPVHRSKKRRFDGYDEDSSNELLYSNPYKKRRFNDSCPNPTLF
eukprot:162567_1